MNKFRTGGGVQTGKAGWAVLDGGGHILMPEVGDKFKRNSDGKVFTITRDMGRDTERAGGRRSYHVTWKPEDGGNGAGYPTDENEIKMNYKLVKRMRRSE